MDGKLAYSGITFDDVLLEPRFSEFVPSEVTSATPPDSEISAQDTPPFLTKDTVTESEMAIAPRQGGGLG